MEGYIDYNLCRGPAIRSFQFQLKRSINVLDHKLKCNNELYWVMAWVWVALNFES
jgi:hypothetical protein